MSGKGMKRFDSWESVIGLTLSPFWYSARVIIGDLNVEGCRETVRECGKSTSGG